MWRENKAFKNENIDLIISINASPYENGKIDSENGCKKMLSFLI